MADMIVNLLDLPEYDVNEHAKKMNVKIFKPLAPDKYAVCEFVEKISTRAAAAECDVCFARLPVTCFVATVDGALVGYACYDAVAKDYFGPTAVLPQFRGKGIGKMLLFKALQAMREDGYIYAIIGSVGPVEFYEKMVNAKIIDKENRGVHKNFMNLYSNMHKDT